MRIPPSSPGTRTPSRSPDRRPLPEQPRDPPPRPKPSATTDSDGAASRLVRGARGNRDGWCGRVRTSHREEAESADRRPGQANIAGEDGSQRSAGRSAQAVCAARALRDPLEIHRATELPERMPGPGGSKFLREANVARAAATSCRQVQPGTASAPGTPPFRGNRLSPGNGTNHSRAVRSRETTRSFRTISDQLAVERPIRPAGYALSGERWPGVTGTPPVAARSREDRRTSRRQRSWTPPGSEPPPRRSGPKLKQNRGIHRLVPP